MSDRGAVTVVGSINLDIVCEVEALPTPGETVMARATRRNVGGKGSNQAVAAALAGADVSFVGRVGEDEASAVLVDALHSRGVDTTAVRTVPGVGAGVAYILVAEDNIITVDSGANMCWDGAADAAVDADAVRSADIVVSQLEVPMDVVRFAAAVCSGRFVLNAAPSREVPVEVLHRADPLVVNEHELADLSGMPVACLNDAQRAANMLRDNGIPSIVVTLGAAGALWVEGNESGVVEAPSVSVVDTTGAGDAFVGNLAAQLARGSTLGDATARAVVSASLSVQTAGTHDSYPTEAAVTAALTKG